MKVYIQQGLIVILLNLTACQIGPTAVMPINHDLGPVYMASGENIPVNLSAPVWFWDERIRYRLLYKDATAIAYYNQNRWQAPLPAILESHFRIPADDNSVLLEIVLNQFEQQFDSPDSASVVMSLEARALTLATGDLIAQKTFSFARHTESADAKGAIDGYVMLMEQANKELASWLKSVKRQEKANPVLHNMQ